MEDDWNWDDEKLVEVVPHSRQYDTIAMPDSMEDVTDASTIDQLSKTYKCWSVFGDTTFTPASKVVSKIPSGAYDISADNSGNIYFNLKTIVTDDLIRVAASEGFEILDDIRTFWTKKEVFEKMGFIWKRGILLYGPPGSGKSSYINMLSNDLIERNGLVAYMNNPNVDVGGLKLLRTIEPDRPILYIIEDIDSAIRVWGESGILALLDGESQIDNIVFIATTNYPHDLPRRLTDRPSRFDVLCEIAYPDDNARREFIINKNSRLGDESCSFELNDWVIKTEGFTFSHIKEVIILVECLDQDLDRAISHMVNMREGIIEEDKYPKGKKKVNVGFMD